MTGDKVIDTDEVVEASNLSESVEMKTIGFFTGINSGFVAAVAGGEQQTEILTAFLLVAFGVRASPGPGRLKYVKKAPNAAVVGLLVGYAAGLVLKDPGRVMEAVPQ